MLVVLVIEKRRETENERCLLGGARPPYQLRSVWGTSRNCQYDWREKIHV